MFIGNGNSFTDYGYIDIIEVISNVAQKKTFGSGIILSSEKEEIRQFLDQFNENNSLYRKFLSWEKALSSMGKVIVILIKTDTGDLYIDIADPYFIFNSRIATFNYKPLSAVIYARFYHSDRSFALVQEYTPTTIKRYLADIEVEGGKVLVGAAQADIPPEYKISKDIANPFGFVPCWEILNIERYPLPGRDMYNFYADTQPVQKLIPVLQFTIHQYIKELYLNKTRIIAQLNAQDQQNYVNAANREAANIIGVNQGINFTDDYFIKAQAGVLGENNKLAEILQGDPKLSEYWKAVVEITSTILEHSGYGKKSSDTVVKTEVMAYKDMSDEAETTSMKRMLRQDQYKQVFDAVLKAQGLWDGKGQRPYTFEIKDGSVLRNREIIDDCIIQIASGLMDRVTAYSKINGVSEVEAINALDKMDKNNEEDKANGLLADGEDTESGEPGDKDPKDNKPKEE